MDIPENDAEEAQAARDRDLPPAAEADQCAATEREKAVQVGEDGTPPLDSRPVQEVDESDEEPVVDAEAVEVDDGPHPELRDAVDEQLGANAELVVSATDDRHEAMLAMDAHDVEKLIATITELAQRNTMRKWVYRLPGGEEGLSIHGVEDITQRMNWTGKCRLRILPETLSVEKEIADAGNGDETFYVATIFAEDQITGAIEPGVSTEPQYMTLKADTAERKRKKGQTIREDNRIFDVFARTKAVGKAKRNALNCFIPTEVEQTVLAMAADNPRLIERIETQAEAKQREWPAPLDTPEAAALREELETIYTEIRELGGGKGRLKLTPATYGAYLLQSNHDMQLLERMRDWLLGKRVTIAEELG